MITTQKIREIVEKYDYPDKKLEQSLILSLRDLTDVLLQEQSNLATKDDLAKVIEVMNQRFEVMNQRFEAIDQRFEAMNQRFEAMNQRFESMQRENHVRFESITQRLVFIQWLIGGGFLAGFTLIFLKLFFPHIFPS